LAIPFREWSSVRKLLPIRLIQPCRQAKALDAAFCKNASGQEIRFSKGANSNKKALSTIVESAFLGN
jgi:hypothetical protein